MILSFYFCNYKSFLCFENSRISIISLKSLQFKISKKIVNSNSPSKMARITNHYLALFLSFLYEPRSVLIFYLFIYLFIHLLLVTLTLSFNHVTNNQWKEMK